MVSLLGKTLREKYYESNDKYNESNDKPKGDILKRKYDEVVVDNNDDDDDDDDDEYDDVKVEIPIKIATPKIPVSDAVSNETEYDSLINELRCYKDGKFIDLRKDKG